MRFWWKIGHFGWFLLIDNGLHVPAVKTRAFLFLKQPFAFNKSRLQVTQSLLKGKCSICLVSWWQVGGRNLRNFPTLLLRSQPNFLQDEIFEKVRRMQWSIRCAWAFQLFFFIAPSLMNSLRHACFGWRPHFRRIIRNDWRFSDFIFYFSSNVQSICGIKKLNFKSMDCEWAVSPSCKWTVEQKP